METAKRLFLDSIAADGNYAPPYNSLGNIESKAGRTGEAIVWYLKAKALSPAYACAFQPSARPIQARQAHRCSGVIE